MSWLYTNNFDDSGCQVDPEPDPNQPPTVNDLTVTAEVGQTVEFAVTASDPDGDTLTYELASPSNGIVAGEGPTYEFTASQVGTATSTVTVDDGTDSDSATVTFVVSEPDSEVVTKVTFCHATPPHNAAQGWVEITTSVNAFFNAGHVDHAADIVPPFSYVKQGETVSFPGMNWDADGQAIFDNGCQQLDDEEPPVEAANTIEGAAETCDNLMEDVANGAIRGTFTNVDDDSDKPFVGSMRVVAVEEETVMGSVDMDVADGQSFEHVFGGEYDGNTPYVVQYLDADGEVVGSSEVVYVGYCDVQQPHYDERFNCESGMLEGRNGSQTLTWDSELEKLVPVGEVVWEDWTDVRPMTDEEKAEYCSEGSNPTTPVEPNPSEPDEPETPRQPQPTNPGDEDNGADKPGADKGKKDHKSDKSKTVVKVVQTVNNVPAGKTDWGQQAAVPAAQPSVAPMAQQPSVAGIGLVVTLVVGGLIVAGGTGLMAGASRRRG